MGALISKNGGQIALIDANKAHVDALNRHGATVTGKMDLKNIPVTAITPDKMEGIYDIAILPAKQTYNETALRQLEPHLSPDSILLPCKTAFRRRVSARRLARSASLAE